MMKIIFIGAGNLATALAPAMLRSGFSILQIYSRTEASAAALAHRLNCSFTTDLSQIRDDADLYLFSVKDSVLPDLLGAMPHKAGLWAHTAGSVPMEVFHPFVARYGVFYPLQTFSKNREVDFRAIPIFIEAHDKTDSDILASAAERITDSVYQADSNQRKQLHLAAIFANNFTNHMYRLAASLVEKNGLPFDALKPLITETAAKIQSLHPADAQTGPAVRNDRSTIESHIAMLDDASIQEIYKLISDDIHAHYK